MIEQIQDNKYDLYRNSLNNCSTESKNQVPFSNINTNINSNLNSFSQENFFNELINQQNYQESKNNSSFYNFSESVHSNQDNQNPNQNIIMNKDQLYQTFILFQKFLNQKVYNQNNYNSQNNKNENSNKYKNNNKREKNNVIDENKDFVNNMSKNDRKSQKYKINRMEDEEDINHKKPTVNKNHYNIINGINNGGNNIMIFKENQNKNILKKNNILKLNDINENNINSLLRNIDENNYGANSYDDIPIKFNKENFIDLVEKKLADEKKYESLNQDLKEENKKETSNKMNLKKDNEKNQFQFNKKIKNKIKNENKKRKSETRENVIDKEKSEDNKEENKENEKSDTIKILGGKKGNINYNYSFDRDDTRLLNENSSLIDNLNNTIKQEQIKNLKNLKNEILNDDDKIMISKKNLDKLFMQYYKEKKIKEYSIEKIEFSLINRDIIKNKKKTEPENDNLNKIEEKEEILNLKIKEVNKELVQLKEEKNKVSKIKLEYEKSMSKLNNDLYQLNQKKEDFEKYRKNELNKIKNDKKNIIIETKNIKEIKSQNQGLILKAKKDKEIIDNLKNKISELESMIKQKDNTQGNIYYNNTYKYIKKRNSKPKANNYVELDIDSNNLNQNPMIDGYYGKNKTNSIRSTTNINRIFCNTIDDKIRNRINDINKSRDKDLENISVSLKRNNTNNKNFDILSKRIEVIKNTNNKKKINNNSLTSSNFGTTLKEEKNVIGNESGERISISKKNVEKTKKVAGDKEVISDKIIFSPQASRTLVGFGPKNLNIKLNNTPKENIKITKKIYENKNKANKKQYSKTITNNLTGSTNSNINTDSNYNSISNINKLNINNRKMAKESKHSKKQYKNELNNNSKINKKEINTQKQPKNEIYISKSKRNLLNKGLTLNKKEDNDNGNIHNENDKNNLYNSINNANIKMKNNKTSNKDNASRNVDIKNNEKKNVTDNRVINMKKYNSFINDEKEEDYDYTIPKKYLNKEYNLIKELKTDDKTINLYNDDKKEIIFKSGVRKEIFKDGYQIIHFVNGDIKQIYPEGKSCYYFKESKTVQIILKSGVEIYKFENGQIERHYPDGSKKIFFNDGSKIFIDKDGEETSISDDNFMKIDKMRKEEKSDDYE